MSAATGFSDDRIADLFARVKKLQDDAGDNFDEKIAKAKLRAGLANGDFWYEGDGKVVYRDGSVTLYVRDKRGEYQPVQTITDLNQGQRDMALVNAATIQSFTRSKREASMGSIGSAFH